MRRSLVSLAFAFLLIWTGPSNAVWAHGSGHEHERDHDGEQCRGGDDGHHEGDRSSSGYDRHHGDENHPGDDGDHEDDEDDDGGTVCPSACPCVAVLPLFSSLVNGQAKVADCIDAVNTTSVATSVGTFVITNSGATPPYCSVGGAPPFISVTAAQALACRALLRQAAMRQSVACHPPE